MTTERERLITLDALGKADKTAALDALLSQAYEKGHEAGWLECARFAGIPVTSWEAT